MCTRYIAPNVGDIERHWHVGARNYVPWVRDMFPRYAGPFICAARNSASHERELVVGQWALLPWFAKTANTAPDRNARNLRRSRATAQPVTAALVPEALTGRGETTLRRLRAADPTFPRLHRLAGCARFKAADVPAWLAAQQPADEAQGGALRPGEATIQPPQ